MKKYSKKKKWIAAGMSVVLVGTAAGGIYFNTHHRSFQAKAETASVQTATVEKGDISTTVVGTGNLESSSAQDVTMPAGVKVDKVLVESGDSVQKGDTLATVDADSVKQAMLDVQEEIDELDEEIEETKDDSTSSYVTAKVSGTVTKIYAKKGKDVSKCSFLTMLGIIIGVASLIVLVSIADGATGSVTDTISSMGTNLLTVSIQDDKENPLRLSDSVLYVTTFYAASADENSMDAAESYLTQKMLERFGNDEDAFTIVNQSAVMETMESVTNTLAWMLGGIAAISLVVGGIGIMNIMLVSVTERTKEIGIRKAIGAGQFSIMAQFLTEALMVSMMGCMAGIALSVLILKVAGMFVSDMSFSISPQVTALAVGFSAFIGIVFGIYPAWKAARKHPIDALRYSG